MSLITRCPACATMFKVVPDQLRISEGWVRCGHCSEVFDATAHLQHAAVTAAAERSVEPPAVVPVALAPEQEQQLPAVEPQPEPIPEPLPLAESRPALGVAAADVAAEPPLPLLPSAPASEEEPLATASAAPADTEAVAEMPAPAGPPPEVPPGPVLLPMPAIEDLSDSPDSTLHGMSFVREARRKAFWRRPVVRAAMLLVCLALLATLGLQVAVHQRDLLAAAEPRSRPWLEAACAQLNCQVQPLRQIEAITIESSSFNKVRGDAYRFGLSVRNKSVLALAMPGIELTLTDAQDRAVLRRVLLPRDLGAAPVLAAGAEWSASLPVNVAGANGGNRIAGYRVLAFYP